MQTLGQINAPIVVDRINQPLLVRVTADAPESEQAQNRFGCDLEFVICADRVA